jgi:glycosyltransferase involved in cell wall biosynthesis
VVAEVRRSSERRAWGKGGGHVLIVVENVPASVDTRVRKQIDSLLEGGYRVSVVSRRHPDNAPYRANPRMRVYEYPAPPETSGLLGYLIEYGISFLAALVLSIRACATGGVDVIQFCQPPDIYFPIVWILRALGFGVVLDQRDLMPELYAARYGSPRRSVMGVLRRLERLSYRSARHFLCVNDYLKDRALDSGVPTEQVTIVRNGPTYSRARRAIPDASLKQGRPFLCCWGGKMGRQDRLDLLVEAIRRYIHERGREDCHFAILGDGECLEATMSLVRGKGLEDYVSFPGWLSEEEVFRYLATADLGLDASLQAEVSPVKAMEYMACGLPFVAFDLDQTRAIGEGAAGFAPAGDAAELAHLIDELLHDPERRAVMGQVGRERVRDELAWEQQAVRYLEAVRRARPVRA